MSGTIILVNGYPGVGKLSAAHELAKQLPNSRVLDTHAFSTLASGIHAPGTPQHDELVAQLVRVVGRGQACSRHTALSALHPASSNPITLLPLTLLTSSRAILTSLLAQAQSQGLIVIHLVLSCSTEANVARALARLPSPPSSSLSSGATNSASASANGHGHARDEAAVRESRMTEEVVQLMDGIVGKRLRAKAGTGAGAGGDAGEAGPNPEDALAGEFEIDTTRLDARTTAMVGAEYIMDAMRKRGVWLQIGAGRKASQ